MLRDLSAECSASAAARSAVSCMPLLGGILIQVAHLPPDCEPRPVDLPHGRGYPLRCSIPLPRAVPHHFRPSLLPVANRPSASRSRFSFVSSRLADSIQPIYARRYEGANCLKYCQARGSVFNVSSM
jgi:hypothetical protein